MTSDSLIARRELLRAAALAIGAGGIPNHQIRAQAPMLKRPIPSTGEEVPIIGMGTWQTFDPAVVDEASLAPLADVLRIFAGAGGTVVDASPMYGKSESVTGRLT